LIDSMGIDVRLLASYPPCSHGQGIARQSG
jgi:hypothetical protein